MTPEEKVTLTRGLMERLEKYNEWRRGGEGEQPEPKEIGEDIDMAIELLNSYTNEVRKELSKEDRGNVMQRPSDDKRNAPQPMTMKDILRVCDLYERELTQHEDIDICYLFRMIESIREFGEDVGKAHRWLGFIQGTLWAKDIYSIDDMRDHNRPETDE